MVVEGQKGADAVAHLVDAMTVGHRTDVRLVGALVLRGWLVAWLVLLAMNDRRTP
jgi:hypothetical protein